MVIENNIHFIISNIIIYMETLKFNKLGFQIGLYCDTFIIIQIDNPTHPKRWKTSIEELVFTNCSSINHSRLFELFKDYSTDNLPPNIKIEIKFPNLSSNTPVLIKISNKDELTKNIYTADIICNEVKLDEVSKLEMIIDDLKMQNEKLKLRITELENKNDHLGLFGYLF
jgi:hypothetical protein